MKIKPKIAIIGWDSASLNIIQPLLESSALPNLSKLIEKGRWGILTSTLHPISPTAWSSFMTGMNPGKHGIFDFVGFNERKQLHFSNGSTLKARTLWSYLKQFKSLVVNVPMTYPPEPINGMVISGMDSPYHDRIYTFPHHLSDKIHSNYPDYVTEIPVKKVPWLPQDKFLDKYIQKLCDLVYIQSSIVCDLLLENSFDFLNIVFTAPDRIQHALGHKINTVNPNDGIGQIYVACDQALGKILESLNDDWTVIVISDHGAQPYNQVFELSSWLEQTGLLKFNKINKCDIVKKYSQKIIWQFNKHFTDKEPQKTIKSVFWDRINWDQTTVICLGAFGSIYLNSKQRFTNGIVEENEAEDICRALTQSLINFKDPLTNKSVIKAIHRGKDIYKGPYTKIAPDLVVETNDDYFIRNNISHLESKVIYRAGIYPNRSLPHTGKHSREGIYIVSGPEITPEKTLGKANIVDIAPTVLYRFGLPINDQMDGHPRLDWFTPEFTHLNPLEWKSYEDDVNHSNKDYSADENTQITNRLKDLGYL